MAGLLGDDQMQGGLLGIDPYALATIAQLFGAKKGDNYGLNIANIESQRQAAQSRAQQAKVTQMQVQDMMRQQAMQRQKDALASQSFAPGVQPLTPNDDQGNPMPSSPGGGGFQSYAQGMMQIDPQAAIQMQAQLAALNQKERVKVGAGETIGQFQGDKFVPAFSAPDKPPTGMTRDAAGNLVYDPNYLKGQEQIRKAGATNVTVDAKSKQENAFATAFGKQNAEDYATLMKNDAMAGNKLNKLSRLESLLASSGKTGKLTPAGMELQSAAASLGFKVDPKLPFQQAAQALSNEMALEMRNPSGGAGMPGALSDSDRRFLTEMVPNLSKTPEGNKILIDSAKKLAQREKDVAKLAREYRQKTGKFDEGFYQQLADYSASHPLFPQVQSTAPVRMRFDAQGNEIQ